MFGKVVQCRSAKCAFAGAALSLGILSACKEPVYRAEIPQDVPPEQVTDTATDSAVSGPPSMSYRDQIFELRRQAIGRAFQNLALGGNRNLSYAEISIIDDTGVQFKVAQRDFVKVPWSDIPVGYRDVWGYDAEAIEAANEDAGTMVAAATPTPTHRIPAASEPDTSDPRVAALRAQISKLDEKINLAQTTVSEAKTFHEELKKLYAIEDKEAAQMEAARVYARMRRSSCSG